MTERHQFHLESVLPDLAEDHSADVFQLHVETLRLALLEGAFDRLGFVAGVTNFKHIVPGLDLRQGKRGGAQQHLALKDLRWRWGARECKPSKGHLHDLADKCRPFWMACLHGKASLGSRAIRPP